MIRGTDCEVKFVIVFVEEGNQRDECDKMFDMEILWDEITRIWIYPENKKLGNDTHITHTHTHTDTHTDTHMYNHTPIIESYVYLKSTL